jgi:5-methylcytosine-specific restriction endonuclease McrA
VTGAERLEALLTRVIAPLKRWAVTPTTTVRRAEVLELLRLAEEARQESVALRGDPTRQHIPADVRRRVIARARGVCCLCTNPLGADVHIDHIIPLARFGTNSEDNLQAICAGCNLRKSARRAG